MEDVWAGIIGRVPLERTDVLLKWSAVSYSILRVCTEELARRVVKDPLVLYEVCALGHVIGLLACAEALCEASPTTEFDLCGKPSLLEWAIRHGQGRIIETLIYDLDVTVGDDPGAFFAAIMYHDAPELLEFLVERGYLRLDLPWKGRTPLYEAVERGRVQSARFLVKEGANPTRHSHRLRTPLTLAVSSEDMDIVKVFVEFGCDLSRPDGLGRSALHHAASTGNAEMVEYLLQHGAPVDQKDSDRGRSPLHYARSVQVVQKLVEAGASLSKTDQEGCTPLHAFVDRYRVRLSDLETLVRAMVEQDIPLDPCGGRQPKTPLCLAIVHGHRDAVVLLLQHGADVNRPLVNKKTPLHYAVENDKWDIVHDLIDRGADVNAGSPKSPLYYAVLACDVEGVKLLVRTYKAQVPAKILTDAARLACVDTFRELLKAEPEGLEDLRDELALAALRRFRGVGMRGGGEVLKALVGYFPKMINEPLDIHGRTVLHHVVCRMVHSEHLQVSGGRRLVSWLLKKGADPRAPDEEGRTPQDYAQPLHDIKKLLDRHCSSM